MMLLKLSAYNFIANICSFFDFKTIFLEKRYNLLYLRFGLIDEKMHRSLRITRHYLLISNNTEKKFGTGLSLISKYVYMLTHRYLFIIKSALQTWFQIKLDTFQQHFVYLCNKKSLKLRTKDHSTWNKYNFNSSRPLRRWNAFIRFNQWQSLLHYKIAIWTLAKTKIVIIKDNFCPRKHHTERTTGKTSKDCKMGPNPF